MRQFLAGDSTNSTAAVKTYLLGRNQYTWRDLIFIGEDDDPAAIRLTDHESPLLWTPYGTFLNSSIKRERKVSSEIGFDVATIRLTWTPPPTPFTTDVATASPYQLAQFGYYDNRKVRIWRCLLPSSGDANTYGACEWFGGWVSDTRIVRGAIVFTVQSFLNVTTQQVPPNVIEAQNTQAGFVGGTSVLADGETSVPTFTVVAPSSAKNIIGDCVQPTAHKVYGGNKFQFGYIVFMPGTTLAGFFAVVATNSDIVVAAVHYNDFQTYKPFPWDPTPGDTFYVSTQAPVNNTQPDYKGFDFVPDPETAL